MIETRAQLAVNELVDGLQRDGFDPSKAIAVTGPEGQLLVIAGGILAWKDWLARQVAELRQCETWSAQASRR